MTEIAPKTVIKQAHRTARRIESGEEPFRISTYREALEIVNKSKPSKEIIFSEAVQETLKMVERFECGIDAKLRVENFPINFSAQQRIAHLLRVNRIVSGYTEAHYLNFCAILYRSKKYPKKNFNRHCCELTFGPKYGPPIVSAIFDSPEFPDLFGGPKERQKENQDFLDEISDASHLSIVVFCAVYIDYLDMLTTRYKTEGESMWDESVASKEDQLAFFGKIVEMFFDFRDENNVKSKEICAIAGDLKKRLSKALIIFKMKKPHRSTEVLV